MDPSTPYAYIQSIQDPDVPLPEFYYRPPDPLMSSNCFQTTSSQRPEAEIKNCDTATARKVQKADREKLRRDRLNEQFLELGNAIDPDRPKNDKAAILADTIQAFKDLTAQVDKLKAEHAILIEESRELTQEKNDLKEEKASLKSDIENLNIQCQQRCKTMFPWAPMDHPVVMAPPSYPFPLPMPMAPGPIPMHPSMQPYPFYGNQNPGVLPNPCSTFIPFMAPPNMLVEQRSSQYVTPHVQPGGHSHVTGKQDSNNKSGESKKARSGDADDVTTDLELKTPNFTGDEDLSSGRRKSRNSVRRENSVQEGSCSSSGSVQDSSSNIMVNGEKNGVVGEK
ncbi:Basic helix-loop-helix DNA-binding superfamily protein [Tripterygium wilfordii]|uniref:Basic helix-loop-helix DNA-binding superfamily protein n=1 Tax=Tripterygium wilfordii TaxID=458696 RepID=A0A7J7C104_TRIWF|nr:transcription factor bHLH121-like [Tripterygium wilfordii]XP_038694822.1 transcription factor bHLH121-like [Tripterygium wilfordii]KAF5727839.1 Basic helix-loop-helix DNA-binding superfamily protein [Tripterygium wilfordii]